MMELLSMIGWGLGLLSIGFIMGYNRATKESADANAITAVICSQARKVRDSNKFSDGSWRTSREVTLTTDDAEFEVTIAEKRPGLGGK